MRVVFQRVARASVRIAGEITAQIGPGALLLAGVGAGDDEAAVRALALKCAELRVFADDDGRFNRSLIDAGGEALVVSQFTLFGDVRRGRRPSFTASASPELAAPLIDVFTQALRDAGVRVVTGVFGAHMQVESVNDGPVTILLDSAVFEQPRRG